MNNEKLNYYSQNIFTSFKDVVNIKDLQKMLGIGRNLAYKLLKENKIEHIRVSNRIYIPKQSVIIFLFDSEVNYER
jgi:hypothetical protein